MPFWSTAEIQRFQPMRTSQIGDGNHRFKRKPQDPSNRRSGRSQTSSPQFCAESICVKIRNDALYNKNDPLSCRRREATVMSLPPEVLPRRLALCTCCCSAQRNGLTAGLQRGACPRLHLVGVADAARATIRALAQPALHKSDAAALPTAAGRQSAQHLSQNWAIRRVSLGHQVSS